MDETLWQHAIFLLQSLCPEVTGRVYSVCNAGRSVILGEKTFGMASGAWNLPHCMIKNDMNTRRTDKKCIKNPFPATNEVSGLPSLHFYKKFNQKLFEVTVRALVRPPPGKGGEGALILLLA